MKQTDLLTERNRTRCHFCYLPCLTDDHRNLIAIWIQSFVFPPKCAWEKDLSPYLKTLWIKHALQKCLTSVNLLKKPQILFAGGVRWQFRCNTGAQNIKSSTTLKNPQNKLLLLALPITLVLQWCRTDINIKDQTSKNRNYTWFLPLCTSSFMAA